MKRRAQQSGYFLIIAILFIVIIGVMGTILAHSLATRGFISVAERKGLDAFYIAESGLEIGARLLTNPTISGTPSRATCASITGTGAVTNASMGNGTFTLTTINSSPIFASTTLNGAISAGSTSIPLTSAASFADSGLIVIDGELIKYASKSGNTLLGAARGIKGGIVASSHANGSSVSQFQCSLDSLAGVPNVTTLTYRRELQWDVQLQDAWLVANETGNNFNLSHWNRPTEEVWTNVLVAGQNNVNLRAVSLVSNTYGWAVGDDYSSEFNFMRWNGTNWTAVSLTSACSKNLRGIAMVSSSEGYAVGLRYNGCGSTNQRYDILKWNGTDWALQAPPTIPADASANVDLFDVSVISSNGTGVANVGAAVGSSGRILNFNGSTWTQAVSPTTQALNGVAMVSPTEGWAVGNQGVILKWNGTTWSTFSSPTNQTINGIVMVDEDGDGTADYGWAACNSGVILGYDGSSWAQQMDSGGNLFAVIAFNRNDAYAGGAAGILWHWNGATWTAATSGTNQQINGMANVRYAHYPLSGWTQVFR